MIAGKQSDDTGSCCKQKKWVGQAEPVQAAGAEDTGKQGDPVPKGGQPGLIFSGTSVLGSFFVLGTTLLQKQQKCCNYILIYTDDSYTIYCCLKRVSGYYRTDSAAPPGPGRKGNAFRHGPPVDVPAGALQGIRNTRLHPEV